MYRYCLIGLMLFSQIILSQSVQAQMYQWADPETGTTQLSGKPPVWYRSAEGGPRVFVFSRGKIIDDTGIEISDEQRISLRTQAFVSAEEDRLAAKQKAMEAAKLKAAMEKSNEEGTGEPQMDSSEVMAMETPEDEELIETETSEDDISIEKMKALISAWENMRTEEARALLQQESYEK